MASLKKVKVVLLASEWNSKHGGISTFNRVLAIQLAQNPKVAVSVFLPECDQTERDAAKKNNITLVQAEPRPGIEKMLWLCHPPKDLEIDFVIGHGVVLGRQAQIITDNHSCKWVQFVHTDPEELGMFKDYPHAVSKGEEKHQTEVKLCEMADFVVTVGPKLAEEYRSHLQYCKKDVFEFTPGIFSEFSDVVQRKDEGTIFRVLLFGRGDGEDFHLKGFDIAARAVAKLHDAQLIFVGANSKEQDEVANHLKECNLPARQLRVKAYMENRDKLKKTFSGVDLAIMPSRTEGFGLAALEALSAGLPILVSGNSGFGQALGKVTSGSACVIPPEEAEDPEEWAKKIQEIKEKTRETRQDESKSLLKNYAKVYNWEKQIEDLVEKMKSIRIGEHAGGKGSGSEPPSEGKKKPVSGDKAEGQYGGVGQAGTSTNFDAGSEQKVESVILDDNGTSAGTSFLDQALSPVEHGAGENPFNTNAETSKISDEQSRQTIQPPLDEEQPFVSPTDLRKLPVHIHPNSKEVYPMFSKPRGIALIINIEIFFHNLENTQKEEEKEQLVNRLGSEKDIEMLEKLFGALDFKVKIERNLKREEIFKVLDNISDEDHSNYDCFVLCLMSHGSEGFVYGADGERVLLETVRNLFSNSRCSTLNGKPKLFVIQASRGNDIDKGAVKAGNPVTEGDISIPQIIPDQADMLMAYSTVSGYASFRNLRYGSNFIRCLVEVFREKAGHEDALSMLTMVNDSISSMGEVRFKQVGQPTSTLTKKLFFWPGL